MESSTDSAHPHTRRDEIWLQAQDEFTGLAGPKAQLMNLDQATRYAARYHNTWRGGPSADVLREQFVDMEPEPLGQVLVELARVTDTPPTVREIWREYRARADTERGEEPTENCANCDGTGWEPGPPIVETVLGEPHEYTTVQRCRCTRPVSTPRTSAEPAAPTLDL